LIRCFDEAASADMRAAGIAQQADVKRVGAIYMDPASFSSVTVGK